MGAWHTPPRNRGFSRAPFGRTYCSVNVWIARGTFTFQTIFYIRCPPKKPESITKMVESSSTRYSYRGAGEGEIINIVLDLIFVGVVFKLMVCRVSVFPSPQRFVSRFEQNNGN